MLVGEAPGADEDKVGEPFVGRSGKLLATWFESIDMKRGKDYYITNIVKCRPPKNRDPQFEELKMCFTNWLHDEIKKINPAVIVPVGRISAQYLLQDDSAMGRIQGRIHIRDNRKIIPIYHPSFILRGNDDKEVKKTLKLIKENAPVV